MAATAYAAWRAVAVNRARVEAALDQTEAHLTRAQQRKVAEIQSVYPADLVACLQVDTAWLKSLGWNQPPGSQRALYWRPKTSLDATPLQLRRSIHAASVNCFLLSLATASRNTRALPVVARTLPQGELLHAAVISHAARLGGHSPMLTGCDSDGQPLRLAHRHAHLLHLDLDKDGHLDHVLVWAPMGLDAHAQAALRAVRRTFTKGGAGPLQLALTAMGSLKEMAALAPVLGHQLASVVSPSGARMWRSITPFVPPRHLKKTGRNSLDGQVAAELGSRGLPPPTTTSILSPAEGTDARRIRHFVRGRRRGPAPAVDMGLVLELVFSEPVSGPVALGYGSHLGLGLFESIED